MRSARGPTRTACANLLASDPSALASCSSASMLSRPAAAWRISRARSSMSLDSVAAPLASTIAPAPSPPKCAAWNARGGRCATAIPASQAHSTSRGSVTAPLPPSKRSARSVRGSPRGGWRRAPRAAPARIPDTWAAYTAWACTAARSAPSGSPSLARTGAIPSGALPSSLSGVHPYILRRRDRSFLSRAGALPPPRGPPTMQSSTNLLSRPAAPILDITRASSGMPPHPAPGDSAARASASRAQLADS